MNNFHNVNNINAMANQQAMANRVQVAIYNWQNGSVQDLINFLSRHSRVSVREPRIDGNRVIGYVSSKSDAETLKKFNGMRFAGNNLKIEILGGAEDESPTVKLLKGFLYRRYDPQNKMLNLGSLHTDVELQQKGLFSTMTTQSKMFPALMKLASKEPQIIVESVNLSDNNLRDINGITTLAQSFPNLKNLCLANNQISRYKSMEAWKNKFKNLRELLMTNNPVTNERTYRSEMLRIFPKLVMLDNVVVRDAQKMDSIFSFPFKIQPFFFENDQLGQSSTDFVSNFLNLWDTDRSQLLQLYTPQSQFSMSSDSSVPPISVKNSDQTPAFGYYLSHSRNITKISTESSIQQKLATGPEAISEIFNSIPMSKHHLQDEPDEYSMESFTYGQVNGFTITLHGFFDETAKPNVTSNKGRPRRFNHGSNSSADKKLGKKSFDRTWVIVPMGNSVVIASDLLTIRPYVTPAWVKPKTIVQQPQSQSQPQPQQIAQQNGMLNMPQAPIMGNAPPAIDSVQLAPTLQLPPDVRARLSSIQLELLNKLHLQTKLNAEYTYMLAEQSGWSYDIAIKGFQSSLNNIPREAYIQ
ncbi:hypothetical protein Kpol_1013p18 [Vanderwaltozyma polyspora DSM 70294]|uniref:mRNA export factor MEX67 n=1 Tax=Vanderwaltozyma polyspora (strain ATCC 22028 / DSM 70294 / BCRC 21397 / CBS 2163 / NBRC 10782 / NRRL Y-8283 / UCD 57-17) TaxID=436907 RepID=A7TH66_VANPO|nr:uncharacterized protein Kpol_1013p18 [Vanderwaltozyma polyspora DSM 70294]EDO18347.1 hypothetical protein Kpol_1013p18 [Vanderwaltozyma polyspora DSM 70294]